MTTPTTTAPASVTLRLQAVLLAAADELTGPAPARAGRPLEDELDEELQLADDLGFDSVMLMSLKASLEEHFPELGELSCRSAAQPATPSAPCRST